MRSWKYTILFCLALLYPASAFASLAHLPNDGFEARDTQDASHAQSWIPYGSGYTLDSQAHSGQFSLRCANKTGNATYGALCTVRLNQTTPTPISLSGWSKALDVAGAPDTDYAIYVDLTYTDGTPLWGQTVSFDTGTHDWQRRHLLIVPAKPVQSINVYTLFRNHVGTVWFDDLDARELSTSSLFDFQAIQAPALPAKAQSGWFVRDVAADSPVLPIGAGESQLGVRLENVRTAGKMVQAALQNETAQDRAVTLYYVERFNGSDPVWWDDIRSSRQARTGEYANLASVDVGANGQISLYPFGCVTSSREGRALGVPPKLGPRVVRIGFNARAHLLYLACDLALTAKGDPDGQDRAPMAVVRYDIDPHWGFRDAAAKYYALFPDAYRRRAVAEGIWMPFTSPEQVQGFRDFHFAYHEGDNSVAADLVNGIQCFRYVEPMTYWMPMPKGMPRDYAHALGIVEQQAASTDSSSAAARRQSQAVLSSGTEDERGSYNVSFEDAPWCDGAVWVLDPNPKMPHAASTWTGALLNQAGEPTPGAKDQPDGEYLDSLEAHADVLNYREESLKESTVPLTFAPDDYRPTIPTWFSVYESAAWLSNDLHSRGKLLMANSTPWRFFALTPLLDVLGTETDMFTSSGSWSPDSDLIMNLRRTLSYHKPYLVLLNADFTKISPAGIEKYFQRCLFYGIYPSMFSADASDNPYWQNPALYNRDRPLFQKYIPAIEKLSQAGWEPVTWARSDNPKVWVERYGTRYLTLLNSSNAPAQASIMINADDLYPGKHSVAVHGLFTGGDLKARSAGDKTSVRVNLQPSEAQILVLTGG